MNKAELIDAMAADANLTKADAKRALDAFVSATTKVSEKRRQSRFSWIWFILSS